MELIYGMHAVDALLRREPARVECLYIRAGRQDKRMTAMQELAQNQGVELVPLSR